MRFAINSKIILFFFLQSKYGSPLNINEEELKCNLLHCNF